MIDYGSLKDVTNNVKADILNELPEVDPSNPASAIRAVSESYAAANYENRLLIAQVENQAFPQTATGVFLERFAEYDGLTRNPATIATGFLTATGTIGTEIPQGTSLTSQSNIILITQAVATIQNISTSVISITRLGNIVTVTTGSDHLLATGVDATIAGANETEYNGTFPVTVISTTVFTYIISTTPTTPATGTITVDFDGAELSVSTQGEGSDQNIESGNIATFSSPIAGLDNTAFVRIDGIEGGTDIENDTDLEIRILENRAAIKSLFNVDFIIAQAKTVSGVTRVFVKEITPEIGDTEVYFMRDNDDNPIPSNIDVSNVNDVLQAIRPANMAEADFVIAAPTPVVVDISLSALVPDTPSMRTNIEAVLADFFTFQVDFEEDVLLRKISSALDNAQDTTTGDFLQDFSLDLPASDVIIAAGQIGILGDITIT